MILSITCRDVPSENCFDGGKETILQVGVLSGIEVEVPPMGEAIHPFVVCFLVPDKYTLLGSSVIHHTNEIMRARVRIDSTQEPSFGSGPLFRVHVIGTL